MIQGCESIFLIFDMDGVIVDSNPYHKKAWQILCQRYGIPLTEEMLIKHVYGKVNRDAVHYVFGETLSLEENEKVQNEKEALYRELFLPHMQPVEGLEAFFKIASKLFAGMAVGTSAPPENVDFVLDNLKLRSYFSVVVDETMVSKGKPDPEIYCMDAQKLGANPSQCIVFEDSLAGIQAARNANMKVVGITTTHSTDELANTVDLVIDSFEGLADNPECLQSLFKEQAYL